MVLYCSKKTISIFIIRLEQKTNLNLIKRYAKKDFCNVVMPSEDTKILELITQYPKSNKPPYIIYSDLQSLI